MDILFSEDTELPFFKTVLDEIKQANYTTPVPAAVPVPAVLVPAVPVELKNVGNNIKKLIPAVVCFLKGTNILTTKGEILIENLNLSHWLLNHAGKPMKLREIHQFTKEISKETTPYKIPKNANVNEFVCNKNLYLSGEHAVLFNKHFIPMNNTSFKQATRLTGDCFVYFHLVTENFYTDVIMANGIPTESYGGNIISKETSDLVLFIYNYITKGRERKLLTKVQFVTLIENYHLAQAKKKKNNITNKK